MGAGAPPRTIVGCRSGVTLAVEPQAWGGPSDWSAYECRAGCSRPFGGGPWPGCADRRRAAGAADTGARAGHRLAAVTARAGAGDLRGRADRLRAGPGPAGGGDRLRGGRSVAA